MHQDSWYKRWICDSRELRMGRGEDSLHVITAANHPEIFSGGQLLRTILQFLIERWTSEWSFQAEWLN
jgi:hypothetical protein